MRFRCPYCGEKTVVFKKDVSRLRSKILVSRLFVETRCLICKKDIPRTVNYKYRYLQLIIQHKYLAWLLLMILWLILMFAFRGLIFSIIPILLIWYATMYFCMHCDFSESSERERRDNIIVEFKDGVPFRKNTNEYVCQFRYTKLSNKEQTYVIFDDTYKGQEKTLKFCMVAGETPCIDDEVKIVTQNSNIFVGKVVQVIPKTATAQTVIPEHPVASSKPQKRKNWKDPDYFN